MKNFKGLKIWQKGFDIAVQSYELVSSFPKKERFGISSQVTKPAVSISSNIAEGSSRNSENDYYRFLQISLGSCFELETQLLIADAVNYGNMELRKKILLNIIEEQKMIVLYA